jgi:predicted RNase H-like HicB family nuclease
MENLNYTVIYEQAEEGNWGAYVPDLPVCCGGAATREELEVLMREAIEIHMEDLKAQGLPVPPPGSAAVVLEAAGYPVVLEQTESGTWSAHSVDLPVFATGKTLEDVRRNMQRESACGWRRLARMAWRSRHLLWSLSRMRGRASLPHLVILDPSACLAVGDGHVLAAVTL